MKKLVLVGLILLGFNMFCLGATQAGLSKIALGQLGTMDPGLNAATGEINSATVESTVYNNIEGKMKIISGGKRKVTFYSHDKIVGEALYSFNKIKEIDTPSYRLMSGKVPDGYVKTYDPSGNLLWESLFENGKPEGIIKYYDTQGKIINETNYENGEPLESYNGDDLSQVSTRYNYANGKFISFSQYYYYDNGSLKEENIYAKDKDKGGDKQYFEDSGILKQKTEYLKGIGGGDGEWWTSIYDENGKITAEGPTNFPDGFWRIGEWKFYNADGSVNEEGDYDVHGNAEGIWKTYWENGEIAYKDTYKNGEKILRIAYNQFGKELWRQNY